MGGGSEGARIDWNAAKARLLTGEGGWRRRKRKVSSRPVLSFAIDSGRGWNGWWKETRGNGLVRKLQWMVKLLWISNLEEGGGGGLVGLDGLFDDCLTNEGRIYIYIKKKNLGNKQKFVRFTSLSGCRTRMISKRVHPADRRARINRKRTWCIAISLITMALKRKNFI